MMMQHRAAHLRDVIKAGKWITDSLSTAGFDDIHEDEVPIVLAMAQGMDPKMIQEMALGRIADRLVSNGYVEFRAIPDAPGRTMLVLTERGLQAHETIGRALGIKRWADFPFRQGDVVISALPKSGTTWMQMICALLIFQTPDLPAPLAELSPWMEWLSLDREKLLAGLAAQKHRRFIKTHTPLKGLPLDPRVTYVVVARHPLDMAVSLYHHYANLDVRRLNELAGYPETGTPEPLPPLREWLLSWVAQDCDPYQRLDTLAGVMHHVADAWSRRAEPPGRIVFWLRISAISE